MFDTSAVAGTFFFVFLVADIGLISMFVSVVAAVSFAMSQSILHVVLVLTSVSFLPAE